MSTAAGPSGPRASAGARLLAAVIDGVLGGLVIVLLRIVFPLGVAYAVGSLASLAYFAYFEGQPAGQTLGKRATGIRVIDFTDGSPLTTRQAVVRSAMRYVSGAACSVGFVWAFFNRETQAWHDLAARTVVVPTSVYPVP